ncbi:hypothetical protein GSI_12271 [Ganoderma sinense ZZ0214-1]|uniref:Uncharacterized protein n=1 Tax=Ganoderma sinense ZZ0214-1 TaxID=1077348 RepID=A0A2G8RYB5_9APHY|nr:hypothetical protein GSI_12271 [Ganoderma sinense ZZ0214-1]
MGSTVDAALSAAFARVIVVRASVFIFLTIVLLVDFAHSWSETCLALCLAITALCVHTPPSSGRPWSPPPPLSQPSSGTGPSETLRRDTHEAAVMNWRAGHREHPPQGRDPTGPGVQTQTPSPDASVLLEIADSTGRTVQSW